MGDENKCPRCGGEMEYIRLDAETEYNFGDEVETYICRDCWLRDTVDLDDLTIEAFWSENSNSL